MAAINNNPAGDAPGGGAQAVLTVDLPPSPAAAEEIAGPMSLPADAPLPLRAAYGTLLELTADAGRRYRINSVRTDGRGIGLGVALGRYPEDIYTGTGFGEANPWFLSTLAAAEFLCRLSTEPAFARSRTNLLELADRQFARVHHHMLPDGGLPEQFDRNIGYVRGARDLTWSYASYLTAYRACLEAGSTPAP
jgi:hypothetical protein